MKSSDKCRSTLINTALAEIVSSSVSRPTAVCSRAFTTRGTTSNNFKLTLSCLGHFLSMCRFDVKNTLWLKTRFSRTKTTQRQTAEPAGAPQGSVSGARKTRCAASYRVTNERSTGTLLLHGKNDRGLLLTTPTSSRLA